MIKILVPVNFSEYSLNGLKFAITLAEKFPAQITMLHCFADYIALDKTENGDKPDYNQLRANIANKDLEQQEKLRELTGNIIGNMSVEQTKNIELKYRFEYGYADDIISTISNKEKFDAVIMGTKTKGDSIKEVIGSITNDVINKSIAPVLAVPAHCAININEIGKILFMLELNHHDYNSLHRLIRIISPFHTEINAVHFCRHATEPKDVKAIEELISYTKTTYPSFHINFEVVMAKDYIQAIEQYVGEHKTDIIAITRRKRNLLAKIFKPSITKKILFNTDIPLLVFQS
jgi:nucleotide-binding universal stress UspA family protein